MATDDRFLEIRSYKLRPGTRERFDTLFRTGALPMLRRHGITVVDFGPSLHDADGYYLMRAYPSLEHRTKVLDAFYGSKEWMENYDADIMAMIDTYTTVVRPATPALLRELDRGEAGRVESPPRAEKIKLAEGASMKDYQRYIHELETMHGWLKVDLVHNCFLMGEEMGELFKAVRRYNKYFDEGKSTPAEQAQAHLAEELVDVFNYLVAIANRTGVDLEQAFREKNARNQERTWS